MLSEPGKPGSMANPPYYGKQIHGVLLLLGYPPLYRQAGTRSPKSRVWIWIQECGSSRCSRACVLSFHGHAMMSFSPPFLLWRPPLEGSRRRTSLCDRQLASGLFPLVGHRLHSPRSRRIYAGAPGAAVKAGRLRPHFLGVALTVAWLPARYTHRVRLDLSATRENARIELCDPSCDVPS
jgi:hypothetical protein